MSKYKEPNNKIYENHQEKDFQDLPWVNNKNQDDFNSLIDSLNIKTDAKILDIGCGTGVIANYLSKKGVVDAIDVSDIVIEHCKNNANYDGKGINFESVDFLDWNTDKKYDFIVAHLLLHDIEPRDVENFSKKLSNLLADDGLILLSWLKQNGDEERECIFNGGISNVYFHKPEKIKKEYFNSFHIYHLSDVEIKTTDDIIKKAKAKKVNGFIYQTFIITKNITKVNLQYLLLKDKFTSLLKELEKGNIDLDKRKEQVYREITDKLYASLKVQFTEGTKIFYNLQLNAQGNPNIELYPKDENGRADSRAKFLVEKYADYYEEIYKKKTKKGEKGKNIFLVHNFFQLKNQDANNIKWIDLYKDDRGIKIKLQYHDEEKEEEKRLKDFLREGAKDEYDIEIYQEYIDFLFDKEATNGFVDYLKERKEATSEACPTHYTIWNLSFPFYDYIGTIIVESKESEQIIISDEAFNEIRNIFHAFKIEYHKCENKLSEIRIRQKSIQSAISAIMSRNMSHNLGSHFITNTKNYIAKYAEKPELDTDIAKDLRGLRHVLQYTQERMDYIATIVSGDQYPLGALNVKAQLFDELTIDDFAERHGKATTNFFLKYLVYSEKYSHGDQRNDDFQNIELQIVKNGEPFTGKKGKEGVEDKEKKIKNELSQLSLAVPGGVMARHALFNILENIMRNSAKHSKESHTELIFSIELEKVPQNNLWRIRINDNKKNALDEGTRENVKSRLKQIKTLNPDGSMNKENKGLKEMLICALWLRNKNVAEILSHIDNEADEDICYENYIKPHFRVIEEGENFGYEFELPEYEWVHTLKVKRGKDGKPVIGKNEKDEQDSKEYTILDEELTDICADVVRHSEEQVLVVDKNNQLVPLNLREIFTRFTNDMSISDEELKVNAHYARLFKKASGNILGDVDFDAYQIKKADRIKEKNELQGAVMQGEKDIVFETHLHTDGEKLKRTKYEDIYAQAVYVDSISGGDFTHTITEDAFLAIQHQKYKVIESALTKIAIIDERIFDKYSDEKNWIPDIDKYLADEKVSDLQTFIRCMRCHHKEDMKEYQTALTSLQGHYADNKGKIREELKRKSIQEIAHAKKNIFLYDFDMDKSAIMNLSKEKCGKIGTELEYQGERVHFLTIHLGLLEKYRDMLYRELVNGGTLKLVGREYSLQDAEKDVKSAIIKHILVELKEKFGTKFITIHSGRGNFSAELEDALKDYSFISLSALEAAFDNSKYFLSQLFYNTIFYGKGNINNNKRN